MDRDGEGLTPWGIISHTESKGSNDMSIAEKLRERRGELGLTQRDLSALTGIHTQTIKLWETDKGEPSLSLFIKLCRATETHPMFFLGAAMG